MIDPHPASGWAAVAAACLCFVAGCGDPATTSESSVGRVVEAPAISVNRASNGAAVRLVRSDSSDDRLVPRELMCVVSGSAELDSALQRSDARSSAAQAAIVDALFRAVLETRDPGGDASVEQAFRVGTRLSLNRLALEGGGHEIRIAVTSAGSTTEFVTRGGRLQHPPHDLSLVHAMFDAAEGDFALLGAVPDPGGRFYEAEVACYAPLAAEILAGDPDSDLAQP